MNRQNIAALYCRLSRDDGRDAESNSISTQRMLLQKYARDHGYIIQGEYIDDGVSGTTFERAGFQKMIEDIEEGKISIVLCKDLSRLGRNNAMISFYTEIFFPDHDIRLIAIGDGIDTANDDNDIMPFKSVINEYYAKDISKKIRSARKAQMQNGQYTAYVAPLGYIKDPHDKHKLIIEEHGARVVRRIFGLAVSGLGTGKIAIQLNDENIPTARQHWAFANPDVTWDWNYHPDLPTCWKSSTVRNILTNRTYIGTFVGHKHMTKSFKNRKVVKVPEDEWIMVPGVHPVIIDDETFNLAQKVLKIKHRANIQRHDNIYVGFLKCSDCGTGLSLKYTTASSGNPIRGFMCNRYRSPAVTNGQRICSAHYVSEKVLENIVLISIRTFAETAKVHENDYLAFTANLVKPGNDKTNKQAKNEAVRLEKRNTELDTIINRLYEDYALGTINAERYQKMSSQYEQEQSQMRERLNMISQSLTAQDSQNENNDRFVEVVRQYTDVEIITRKMLVSLIDKIVIFNGTGRGKERNLQIDIHYRFSGLVDSNISDCSL